jgi:hypothetical protein
MSTEDLKERLAYFEMRLAEATQKAAAKETYSAKFSAGFTTEKLKSWNEVIALIQERIASIKVQL